jgi:hypothetical protein
MNTTEKGDLSLAMILARFLQKGYIVLKPISESRRYDLVIDRGSGFERIQCKTGRLRDGSIVFNTASIASPHRGGFRRHYHGEIESFAVYCPETEKCYLVPIDKTAQGNCRLRVEKSKNNQTAGVTLAKDFEM